MPVASSIDWSSLVAPGGGISGITIIFFVIRWLDNRRERLEEDARKSSEQHLASMKERGDKLEEVVKSSSERHMVLFSEKTEAQVRLAGAEADVRNLTSQIDMLREELRQARDERQAALAELSDLRARGK